MKYDTVMTGYTTEMTGWSYFAIQTRIPDTSHIILLYFRAWWPKKSDDVKDFS